LKDHRLPSARRGRPDDPLPPRPHRRPRGKGPRKPPMGRKKDKGLRKPREEEGQR
jgi:hypothetical protein